MIGIVLFYSGVSEQDFGLVRIWLVKAVFLFLKINVRKIFQRCCLCYENFVEYVIDLQLKVC